MIELIYKVDRPMAGETRDPVPAVVLIHGWKGNEQVMRIFRQAVPPGAAAVFPRAPFPVPDGGYGWIREKIGPAEETPAEIMTEGVAALQRLLHDLPTAHHIDPRRIVLVGFSQGAAVANSLVLTGGGPALGVASIAGFTPPRTQSPPTLRLDGMRAWIAHGSRDEWVPLSAARETEGLYRGHGATVTMDVYETGHRLPLQGMQTLRQWLHALLGAG